MVQPATGGTCVRFFRGIELYDTDGDEVKSYQRTFPMGLVRALAIATRYNRLGAGAWLSAQSAALFEGQ